MSHLIVVLFTLSIFIGQVYGQDRVVCGENCEIGADIKSAATKGNAGYAEDYIETVPTMQQGMTQFIITGDNSRNKLQTMPGGGYSTIKIELPSNWDSLMKELGYSPIRQFYIN